MEQKFSEIMTPMHKVGVKILSDQQLINIFPNYDSLLKKIENHRRAVTGLKVCDEGHY